MNLKQMIGIGAVSLTLGCGSGDTINNNYYGSEDSKQEVTCQGLADMTINLCCYVDEFGREDYCDFKQALDSCEMDHPRSINLYFNCVKNVCENRNGGDPEDGIEECHNKYRS